MRRHLPRGQGDEGPAGPTRPGRRATGATASTVGARPCTGGITSPTSSFGSPRARPADRACPGPSKHMAGKGGVSRQSWARRLPTVSHRQRQKPARTPEPYVHQTSSRMWGDPHAWERARSLVAHNRARHLGASPTPRGDQGAAEWVEVVVPLSRHAWPGPNSPGGQQCPRCAWQQERRRPTSRPTRRPTLSPATDPPLLAQ